MLHVTQDYFPTVFIKIFSYGTSAVNTGEIGYVHHSSYSKDLEKVS
jgi:hypothetical protein